MILKTNYTVYNEFEDFLNFQNLQKVYLILKMATSIGFLAHQSHSGSCVVRPVLLCVLNKCFKGHLLARI